MLHIVLLHYFNQLYLLASCKGLIFVYEPSSAPGKTLFLLIMFLSTINCLSFTIYCVHSTHANYSVLHQCLISRPPQESTNHCVMNNCRLDALAVPESRDKA